ncbi:beta/alpha barrel domain-containing protein [Actinokineospora iranica]|nr:hypothetical protein [Actinokineospora iranica]
MDRISLVDVTLRDGGYMNEHSWTRKDSAMVVEACEQARILLCEVGYFRPRLHTAEGKSRPAYCSPPDYLVELRERFPQVVMTVMARPADVEPADYRALAEGGASVVRFPATPRLLPDLGEHLAAAQDAGLRVTLNLIRVSEVAPAQVRAAAELAQRHRVDAFYLADSNGSLFPAQVTELFALAAEATDVPLGFHAHDGLSLAFINSLTALEAGCRYLDASIGGVGKGGGNLSLELVAGYLRTRRNARFTMAPLTRVAPTVLRRCDRDAAARFDSMASGLLDLNMEETALVKNEERELVALVDARPSGPVAAS